MAKRRLGLFDKWLKRTGASLPDGVESLRTPAGLDELAETVEVQLHELHQERLPGALTEFLSSVVQGASYDKRARREIADALPSLLSPPFMASLVKSAADDEALRVDIAKLLADRFGEWSFRTDDLTARSDDPVTRLVTGMASRRLLGDVAPPKNRKPKGPAEPEEGTGPLEFKNGFGFLSDPPKP